MSAARRDRLRLQLKDEGLEAVLISNPTNVSYLTGFSGDSSYLILGRQRAVLVSDGRFKTQLVEECPGLETVIRPPTQPVGPAAAETLAKLGFRAVGFESGHLTVADFDGIKELAKTVDWKPGEDRVERLRQIKDEDEIGQIRQAIRFAERAFAMFRACMRPGDTEKDLADAMEGYVRRAGGRCGAFPAIVAMGDRAALPHAPPTDRRLCEAPLVLVDWGASGAFYKSDLTRVLLTHHNAALPGEPGASATGVSDPKIAEVYAVVLRAQLAAIATVRPGVQAKEVDAAARKVIAAAGYGDYFTHSVGHGIGLLVHEQPFLRANTESRLEAGMVVTVEPGIYLPGSIGIRIEDDILVTADGREVLTSVPKDMESAFVNG